MTLRHNALQFAVVREDPEIEAGLVRAGGIERVLLVASGGCTALCLRSEFPELDVTLLDVNPAQLDHVRRKIEAITRGARLAELNVGSDDRRGLNARGNFEGLFRGLRDFFGEHLLAAGERSERLAAGGPWDDVFAHRYWAVGFELFFGEPLLRAMFGEAAIQHAPPGSYPAHFRGVFERGLRRADAADNYFVHHALAGCYPESRPSAWPRYLATPPRTLGFSWLEQPLTALSTAGEYDLVSLSNLFDWMSEAEAAAVAARLKRDVRPGARVMWRQLNHAKDFQRFFTPEFEFDLELAARALEADRSLFYSRLCIGRHR